MFRDTITICGKKVSEHAQQSRSIEPSQPTSAVSQSPTNGESSIGGTSPALHTHSCSVRSCLRCAAARRITRSCRPRHASPYRGVSLAPVTRSHAPHAFGCICGGKQETPSHQDSMCTPFDRSGALVSTCSGAVPAEAPVPINGGRSTRPAQSMRGRFPGRGDAQVEALSTTMTSNVGQA